MIKIDTVWKRSWVVLLGIWCLLSLVFAAPYADIVLGNDNLANGTFVFFFLGLSPMVPFIYDWVLPNVKFRWVLWVVVSIFLAGIPFLLAILSSEEGVMAITFLWWTVFSLSFWLLGQKQTKKMSLSLKLENPVWLWGILSAILMMLIGMVVGVVGAVVGSIDQSLGTILGQLGGLTLWVFAWYRIRRGKPQLYRWRNFLFVIVIANWIGFVASVFSPTGFIIGPVVLVVGILAFVVPRPKELQAD